jgi:hypothetical protein
VGPFDGGPVDVGERPGRLTRQGVDDDPVRVAIEPDRRYRYCRVTGNDSGGSLAAGIC